MGAGVIEGLDTVVDVDGDGAGDAGEIAANHENYAEFAEGVSEAEDNGGEQAGKRERQDYAEKSACGTGTENDGGVEEAAVK